MIQDVLTFLALSAFSLTYAVVVLVILWFGVILPILKFMRD